MIDEPLQEQASLYVLGALEPEEARAFEAQLASSDELRRHVDELSETIAQLAHAAPPRDLPPDLERRIFAEIHQAPTAVAARSSTWIPWAVAACLAIACLLAFADRQRLTNRLATLRDDNARAETRVSDAQQQIDRLAAEKDRAERQVVELREREADARAQMATLAATRDDLTNKLAQREAREAQEEQRTREAREREVQPSPPPRDQLAGPGGIDDDRDSFSNIEFATLSSKMTRAPNATAAIAWDAARQRGVLNARDVPPTAPDREYQLWIVDSRFADPISAGVFRVEKNGTTRYVFKPTVRIESATAFAVSLERKGGVAKAEGPIVLAGK